MMRFGGRFLRQNQDIGLFAKQVRYQSTSVLITGANRGIGLELCKQYLSKQYQVFACCREPFNALELESLQKTNPAQLSVRKLDVVNDAEILDLAASLKNVPIDILLLNAGIMGDKNISDLGLLNREDLMNTINVNCIGPLLVAQALFENVKLSERKQIVGLTSLMGSITDNEHGGGRVSYRVSKSAMNSAFQELKLKGKEDGIHTLLLHPGWVQTDMGGPNATKTIAEATTELMTVIDDYKNMDSGGFYNYAGKRLPW